MIASARLSDCGLYRYTLSRIWEARGTPCVFVMLNPSTADAAVDDPTIRRCVQFARQFGCGSLAVVNLFAFRATKPADMKAARDPVGPENDAVLRETFTQARSVGSPVVAAWGAHGKMRARDAKVCRIAADVGVALSCLGRTSQGAPKHPLYIANGTMRETYRAVPNGFKADIQERTDG